MLKFPEKIIYIHPCVNCQKNHMIEIPFSGFQKYKRGACVQDAFPDVDLNTREFLVSGICPNCIETLFSEDEDEKELISDAMEFQNGDIVYTDTDSVKTFQTEEEDIVEPIYESISDDDNLDNNEFDFSDFVYDTEDDE